MTNRRPSRSVVEVVRLFTIVVFTAGAYEVVRGLGDDRMVIGPFSAVVVGLILGSATGYVLGGILGRTTTSTVLALEEELSELSAADLLASGLGLVCGVIVGAVLAWPLFLLRESYVSYPGFGFVVVTFGYLGLRLGQAKQVDVLALFGMSGRLAPGGGATSGRPKVLDTSVIIDGRLLDVVKAGFVEGHLILPQFVLAELHSIADSGDELRRARGRRGLEVLAALQRDPHVDVRMSEEEFPEVFDVDAKLVRLAREGSATLVTNDFNLSRVAELQGVSVLNLNELAAALRPVVLPGEMIRVQLQKEGREAGQGVGYLEDGTMVVVEGGRGSLGKSVDASVTSVLQTSAGRMIFCRLTSSEEAGQTGKLRQGSGPTSTESP
ncbi:MAG: PIN domain-containing protein [Actinomycetota bacterium]